jgi:hypothetical protein
MTSGCSWREWHPEVVTKHPASLRGIVSEEQSSAFLCVLCGDKPLFCVHLRPSCSDPSVTRSLTTENGA